MTRDEAFSELESIAHSGSAFFIVDDVKSGWRYGGPCQIIALSPEGFTVVRSGGFSTFTWRLDIDSLRFESRHPLSLPEDEQKQIPALVRMCPGLLISSPSGETLFLMAER